MRKFLLFLFLLLTAPVLFAQNTQLGLSYTGASHLTQIKASVNQALSLNTRIGLAAKFADEENFKNPNYALYVPISIGGDFVRLSITPFYYFKNKTALGDLRDEYGRPFAQNSYAYGASAVLLLTMQQDDLDGLYSNAFLGASFARSQGMLFADDGISNRYYSQAAFSAGLHRNFYQFISFELAGTAFQYPDGIKNVNGFYSVLDQQDLANMQTFDVVHLLPKYTVAARATRLWTERMATIYLGYRFGEFYGADSQHSFVLGNTFAMTASIHADIGYNHLRTVHNENKRDIFYARLSTKF